MKISIFSRTDIEQLLSEGVFPDKTAVVSFYDPVLNHIDSDYHAFDYSDVCDNVIYCELEDFDIEDLRDARREYRDYFPEADNIAEFIYQAFDNGLDIICQCEYGQSRSAGCAAAILEHFYGTGITVFADYQRYPNRVVFHKVYDALERLKRQRENSYY